jgi:hypothetical protein
MDESAFVANSDPIFDSRKRNTIELRKTDSPVNHKISDTLMTWAMESTSSFEFFSEEQGGNSNDDPSGSVRNHSYRNWKKIIISYDVENQHTLKVYHCDKTTGDVLKTYTMSNKKYDTTAGYLRFFFANPGYVDGGPNAHGSRFRPMYIDGLQIIRGQALSVEDAKLGNYNDRNVVGVNTNEFRDVCQNQTPKDCYTGIDTTSSYLKKQAYMLLDGTNQCIYSQPECNWATTDVIPTASNDCVSRTCTVGGTNVGYTWNGGLLETQGTDTYRGSNIEIYGECEANGECSEFEDYIMANAPLNQNDFQFKTGNTLSTSTQISSGFDLSTHIKIKNQENSIMFKNQPIDLTTPFTIMYFAKTGRNAGTITILTEHTNAHIVPRGGNSCIVDKDTKDALFDSRKRNIIEIYYGDNDLDYNSQKTVESLKTFAKDTTKNDNFSQEFHIDNIEGKFDTSKVRYVNWKHISIVYDGTNLKMYHLDASGNFMEEHIIENVEYTTKNAFLQFYFRSKAHNESAVFEIKDLRIHRNRAFTLTDIQNTLGYTMESSFDSTNFLVRFPDSHNQGKILTDAELSSYVTFGRPLQLHGPGISITFLNQPIDMTKSFTVVYWQKMTTRHVGRLATTTTRTLITEHFDTVLYDTYNRISVIEGSTKQDPIWNSRKRNTVEVITSDNGDVNHSIRTWAKTNDQEPQQYQRNGFDGDQVNTDARNSGYLYNLVDWKKTIISYNHVAKTLTLHHCLENGTLKGSRTITNVEYTTTAGYLRFYYEGPHPHSTGFSGKEPTYIDGLRIIRGQALTPSETSSYSKTDTSPTVDSSGEVTNTLDYHCTNQPSVDCYVPVGSTSTYLKKQGYNFLDGNQQCILSQTDCEPLSEIEESLSNACESKSCTVSGTNVGYTWSNAKFESLGTDSQGNNIEIYGRCVPNTTGNNVCDEIGANYILSNTQKANPNEHFDVKSYSYNVKFTDIGLGASRQHNKLPNGSSSVLNRDSVVDIREDYPIKLTGGHVITFKTQSINMIQSFTVIYWIIAPDTSQGCLLITEHKDVPLFKGEGSQVTKINEDSIWNARKRNTIELWYYDGKRGGNGHNKELFRTWAKNPDTPDTPQRYVNSTQTPHQNTWEGQWPNSPVRYYDSWRKIAIVHDASANTLTAYHYDNSNNLKLKHTTSDIQYTTTEGYLRFVHFEANFHSDGMSGTSTYRPMLIDGVQILRNQALSQADIEADNSSQPTKTLTEVRSQYYFR